MRREKRIGAGADKQDRSSVWACCTSRMQCVYRCDAAPSTILPVPLAHICFSAAYLFVCSLISLQVPKHVRQSTSNDLRTEQLCTGGRTKSLQVPLVFLLLAGASTFLSHPKGDSECSTSRWHRPSSLVIRLPVLLERLVYLVGGVRKVGVIQQLLRRGRGGWVGVLGVGEERGVLPLWPACLQSRCLPRDLLQGSTPQAGPTWHARCSTHLHAHEDLPHGDGGPPALGGVQDGQAHCTGAGGGGEGGGTCGCKKAGREGGQRRPMESLDGDPRCIFGSWGHGRAVQLPPGLGQRRGA